MTLTGSVSDRRHLFWLCSMEFGEQIEVVKKDATEDIHHIPKPARSARLISVSCSSEYRALNRLLIVMMHTMPC